MPTKIEMPKLSDTMAEGTVVRWLKQVGDVVEIGDEIAEIETDKATMAMEAFDDGVLARILVEEGSKAEIGAVLAILTAEGEKPIFCLCFAALRTMSSSARNSSSAANRSSSILSSDAHRAGAAVRNAMTVSSWRVISGFRLMGQCRRCRWRLSRNAALAIITW